MRAIRHINELSGIEDEDQICFITPLDEIKIINKVLLKCYYSLAFKGRLGIRIQTLETKEELTRKRLGSHKFKLIYPFIYIIFRFLPKLRIIGPVYLWVTGPKTRWISKTEILGRLQYCGFEVVYCSQCEHDLKIIAIKYHMQSLQKNPSYHALIALDRVGYGGRIIKIHKLRTMHPYSEFLQKQIFEENNISAIG